MRKTIRLTGRKQLPQSAFDFRLAEVKGHRVATLTLSDPAVMQSFPPHSEIKVKLNENKLVQVLDFGTIAKPATTADVGDDVFRAPSCQVRVVNRATNNDGMLLGSTRSWTLTSGGDPDSILLFQPAPIAPRLWKLDIRDGDEQPVLYIDENLPDASLWARTNAVFAACVLPAVISEIMFDILKLDEAPDGGWRSDWLGWVNILMPGTTPPFKENGDVTKKWISELIDAFAARHGLAASVISSLGSAEDKS